MNLAQATNSFRGLGEAPVGTAVRRTIPFDYAFRFELKGKAGETQNKTLTVSVEASFTAVSIGYGVVPKVNPIVFGVAPSPPGGGIPIPTIPKSVFDTSLGEILGTLAKALDEDVAVSGGKIGPRTAAVLKDGLRFNPEFAERIFLTGGIGLDEQILREAFQAVGAPPDRIQFKYSLFDEGSGREFQSEPILSTAGLGSSDGVRPFRYFARPIEFAPRTTMRMQIEEVSDFQGELHVSLQGYKTLGGFGTPTSASAARPARRRMRR